MNINRKLTALLLLALILLLCGCKQNPSQESLDAKLLSYLTDKGYACQWLPAAVIDDPAIYDASAWRVLQVGADTVYVYYDESNRADYLSGQIDADAYGYATHFGLRYVLNYRGDDPGLLLTLQTINE